MSLRYAREAQKLIGVATVVSRAFQVLSDQDKKTKYDKFGGDPESRFGAGSSASGASPFSGFASQRGAARAGGPMFDDEISPEDLFRQFFGGGMGGQFGGPFGGTDTSFGRTRIMLTGSAQGSTEAHPALYSTSVVAQASGSINSAAASHGGGRTITSSRMAARRRLTQHFKPCSRYSCSSFSRSYHRSSPPPPQPTLRPVSKILSHHTPSYTPQVG